MAERRGKMTPARGKAKTLPYQTIYSSKLKDKVIIARDEAVAKSIKNPEGFVIYTQKEADMLKGQPDDTIRFLHEAKKILGGTIISITKEDNAKEPTKK